MSTQRLRAACPAFCAGRGPAKTRSSYRADLAGSVAEHRLSRMLLAGFVPDALTGILVYFQGREASPKRSGGGSPGLPVLVIFKGGLGRQRVVAPPDIR